MNNCYPSDIFVDQDSLSEMICVVCDGVIKQVMMDSCGHYFGQTCIRERYEKLPVCPVTGCEIDPQKLAPCIPLNNLIQRLGVKCKESDECGWKGKCSEWEAHVTNDCQFVVVNCTHNSCTFKDQKRHIQEHETSCYFAPAQCGDCNITLIQGKLGDHHGTCEFKTISCPLNCQEMIMRRKVEEHLANECIMREIECELKPLGCKFKGQHSALLEHIDNQQTFVAHMNLCFLGFVKINEQVNGSMLMITERLNRIEQKMDQNTNGSNQMKNGKPNLSLLGQGLLTNTQANDELVDIKSDLGLMKHSQKTIETKLSKCMFEIDKLAEMQKFSQSLISNMHSILNQSNSSQLTIAQTTNTAKSIPSKENEKEKSFFGGKLETIRQMSVFSENSKAPKIVEKEEYGFDSATSGKRVNILSNKEVSYAGSGRIVLFKSSCFPSRVYKFQFENLTSEHSGIGFCLKKSVSENGFIEPEGANHGCFLFYSNGEQLIHGQEDTVLPLDQKLTFSSNDRLSICFDPMEDKLICTNMASNKRAHIKIKKDLDLMDLYPCVKLSERGERVKILGDGTSDNKFIEFDPVNKGSCLDLIAKNEVISLGDCNIAYVKTKLSTLKVFKFHVTRLVDAYAFAVGACRQSVIKANDFSEQPCADHGCYLFFANGDQLKNGEELVFTPSQWIVEFEEGDVLEIYLDIKAKKLVCKNTSNSSIAEISLKNNENLDDLYPCVQMGTRGERIKLI